MARPRSAPRHDRDAGGPADVLAAKAALRDEVWSAMRAARVARFPGASGRIPNFTGAEAAAERLRGLPVWQAARTLKSNPDSAQLPVRQRALEDGKTVYMAVPRLAGPEPFFALDPDHLSEPPRKAASISGASRSARRVSLAEIAPVDLVVMGSVAAGEDGARLGKGGGFADLEFALATAAGLIGPHTVSVTTVHELQLRPAGTIPLTSHDVLVDFIVTPERVIDCRPRHGARPAAGIQWDDLTEEKIAAIPLLSAQRDARRLTAAVNGGQHGTRHLFPEGVAHVPAGVLHLLADLPRGAADALALAPGLQVRVTGGPARLLLGPALPHLEPVPHLVEETHVSPPRWIETSPTPHRRAS